MFLIFFQIIHNRKDTYKLGLSLQLKRYTNIILIIVCNRRMIVTTHRAFSVEHSFSSKFYFFFNPEVFLEYVKRRLVPYIEYHFRYHWPVKCQFHKVQRHSFMKEVSPSSASSPLSLSSTAVNFHY